MRWRVYSAAKKLLLISLRSSAIKNTIFDDSCPMRSIMIYLDDCQVAYHKLMSNNDQKHYRQLKRHERIASIESSIKDTKPAVIPKTIYQAQHIKEAWDQLLGARRQTLEVDQDLAYQQESLQKEKALLKREVIFEQRKIREQRYLGLKENENNQAQIENLRIQLKGLLSNLDQEVKYLSREVTVISVEQEPGESGIYHLNFFQQIIETITLARKKVQDAATWLIVWKTRSAKQRGMLLGYKGNTGQKSHGAGVHMMIGSEMGSARSGA